MKVYLLKDIEKVGIAGEIIKVSEGYFNNFLAPKKMAIKITDSNIKFYSERENKIEARKEVISSNTSLLANKIVGLNLKMKKKMDETGKLYGAISPKEIVDLLEKNEVKISKNQVIFEKAIKKKGVFKVKIKLSVRLQPEFVLEIL